EGLSSDLGDLVDPRDLADVLHRGGLDLLARRGRLEPAQRRDVPAHTSTLRAPPIRGQRTPRDAGQRASCEGGAMKTLIIVLLVAWLLLSLVGALIEGLLWLLGIGLVLLVLTGLWGWFKLRTRSTEKV